MNSLRKIVIVCVFVLTSMSCGGPQDDIETQSTKVAQQEQKDTSSKKSDTVESKASQDSCTGDQNRVEGASVSPNKTVNGEVVSSESIPRHKGILVWGVLFEFVCILYLFLKQKKSNKEIEDIKTSIENIRKEYYGKINLFREEINSIKVTKTVDNVGKERTPPSLVQKKPEDVTPKDKEGFQRVDHTETEKTSINQPKQPDTECMYLKHFKNGILEPVEKENAFYQVTYEIGSNSGRFEFEGDAIIAIRNKNSILDDVCETSGYFSNARQITTKKWGTCERQPDGKWIVKQKALLSFK